MPNQASASCTELKSSRETIPELFSDKFSEMTPKQFSDMFVRGFLIANYREFRCPGSTYSDRGFQIS
jgi:hypothetical protein